MGISPLCSNRGIHLQNKNTAPQQEFCNVYAAVWTNTLQSHGKQKSNIAELLNIFSEFSSFIKLAASLLYF